MDIVLSTLNARYIHAAFGLRYLKANLRELEPRCEIQEFTLESRPQDVVEKILSAKPKVVGIGVYIWNVEQSTQVAALLKAVSPETILVLGGPEVSYEQADQEIVQIADFVISGWGEVSFYLLCQSLLESNDASQKFIEGQQAKLSDIEIPYFLYSDEDIRNRVLYVEASRGCPFKCEFCLSALDKTAWPFELDRFLQAMDDLYQRGARHFKFVDRTFNLKIKNSLAILDFFHQRLDENLFLHFEVIPDHLPDALKQSIARFPSGSLQFEIGIQTFNQEVQKKISRRQNNGQAKDNLRWIREHSNAYIHADLIFGLPGESVESFADSFDQLIELNPHEIQVGILKRLKGSPIIRHAVEHQMVFSPNTPFSIIKSDTVNYQQVQEIGRFARFWDLIANSGRFQNSLPLLLDKQAFNTFASLSGELYRRLGRSHKIALSTLFDQIFEIGEANPNISSEDLATALARDYAASGLKGRSKFKHYLAEPLNDAGSQLKAKPLSEIDKTKLNKRQKRQGLQPS